MKVTNQITKIFSPQLRVVEKEGQRQLVNTTGDRIDPRASIILDKENAAVRKDEEGLEYLGCRHPQTGETMWIAKDHFQEVDKSYYLPTYQDSSMNAGISGYFKGMLAGGALTGATAGLTGIVANQIDGDGKQILAGAGLNAGLHAGMHLLLAGTGAGLPAAMVAGMTTGIAATQAGDAKASVRDGVYGGALAGGISSLLTGNPLMVATSAAAAGLGGQATSRTARVVTSGLAGAALGSLQVLVSAHRQWEHVAISAATATLGSLVGESVMQATRNGTHGLTPETGKILEKMPRPLLKATAALPYAMTGLTVGTIAGTLIPGARVIAPVVGAVTGEIVGIHLTNQKLKQQ